MSSPKRLTGLVFVWACAIAVSTSAQTPDPSRPPGPGTVRGIVVDRAGGAPIADVAVAILDLKMSVKTDADGRFQLDNVAPGRTTLNVSVVGFILVKRTIDVPADGVLDLTIPLSEGTGTYSETLTVTGERFQEQEKSVASQQTLGSAEVQNLRNLLTNDPMRAIQVLPGVTTGDDFRSEFAVRASPFSHMNFTFDGVATSFLLHTVQHVQDGGSIAMLNGDILDGITLLNGSYPQRYGNRLGAELDFHMRDGSRDRAQTRVGVSGTDASIVTEGPLGGRKAGSWLVSARKSYLELLLKQIDDLNDVGFGFSDMQAKVVYDVTKSQRAELSLVAGRSRLDQKTTLEELNEVHDGRNSAVMVNAGWRYARSPSLLLTQRVAFAINEFSNTNAAGDDLNRGSGRDVTWLASVIASPSALVGIEAGAQVQWQQRDLVDRLFETSVRSRTVDTFDASVTRTSAYVQTRWTPAGALSRLTITPGVRVDQSSIWSTTGSPWVLGELRITRSLRVRGGGGVYRQVPGVEQSAGSRGGLDLVPERAVHADIGVEQTIGSSARWQATFYNRRERDVLRLPDAELRVVGARLVPPSASSRWTNVLDGYARGIELLYQRRSTRGLTGWISYALGFNRYHDRLSGESFDGDFDQRHTFNAYGLYRLSDRFSMAAKLRAGSNTPATGYWEERGGNQFVSARRNDLRLPPYARLDVRANRTFTRRSNRLTLFVEVMNVLGRDNVRFNSPGVNGRTGQAFGMFESMIPRVPSAGVLLEF